jgi:N-acyl-D-aspartate/D-glutamate deacylase
LDYLRLQDNDYDKIVVATAPTGAGFVGRTIAQVASNQGVSAEEALLNIITATNAQVVVFDHNLSTEHVEALLASPLSIISTDGAGYSRPLTNLVHPRCYGTMPRFLAMVRRSKIIKWEHAIKKLTSEPARILGIADRGLIAKGMAADLVVFDPIKISDRATFEQPYQLSEGVSAVIINGHLAFFENEFKNYAGTVLSRRQSAS